MSLETLIEAAEFLERNGHLKSDNAGLRIRSESLQLGDLSSSSGSSSGAGTTSGHLRLDPNLPISFQFHTYSSLSPSTNQANRSLPAGADGSGSTGGKRRQNQNSAGRAKSASFSAANRGAYGTTGCASTSSASSSAIQCPTGSRRGARNVSMSESGCSSPSSFSTTRHRELHKTLEKNRRAHLRSCFEQLKQELPKSEYTDRKCSHINIIQSAIKHIAELQQMQNDKENELRRLADMKKRYVRTVKKLFNQFEEPIAKYDTSGALEALMTEKHSPDEHQEHCTPTDHHSPMDACSTSPAVSDHTQQMDQLLIQVQRTLWCGNEAANQSASGSSHQPSLSRATTSGDELDANEPVPRVDGQHASNEHLIQMQSLSDRNSHPLACDDECADQELVIEAEIKCEITADTDQVDAHHPDMIVQQDPNDELEHMGDDNRKQDCDMQEEEEESGAHESRLIHMDHIDNERTNDLNEPEDELIIDLPAQSNHPQTDASQSHNQSEDIDAIIVHQYVDEQNSSGELRVLC